MDGDSAPHARRLGITQARLAEENGHRLVGVGPARRPDYAGASKHASETTGNAPSRQGINPLGGLVVGHEHDTRRWIAAGGFKYRSK